MDYSTASYVHGVDAHPLVGLSVCALIFVAVRCEWLFAHFKIPRYVSFVDDYPMTVTGKVQKFKLRAAMAHEFGLQGVA